MIAKRKLAVGLMLVLPSITALAQETEQEVKKKVQFKLSDVQVSMGIGGQTVEHRSFSDFQVLAPNSPLLAKPIGDDNGYFPSRMVYPKINVGVHLGFDLLNNRGKYLPGRPLVNLGLQYSVNNLVNTDFSNFSSAFYDSFKSNSGEVLMIDSFRRRSKSAHYISSHLMLDANVVFRTNPSKRWSIYGGLGFGAGFTFLNRTSIIYNESAGLQSNNAMNGYSIYAHQRSSYANSEVYNNKMGFAATVYVPYGISYRLSNTHSFFKKVSLFYEGRVGMTYTHIPEIQGVSNKYWTHHLGMRINF